MLKKQTVWLLTMLSLLVVLSVYYIMSPSGNELALIDQNESLNEEETNADLETTGEESSVITNLSRDEHFTSIRMELQDDRSEQKSRLESIVASSTASVEEKDIALREIDAIVTMNTTEAILEETLLLESDFEDILVRNSKDGKVHVHVRTDELQPDEALAIMQTVRDEYGRDVIVEVNYQPIQSEK